MEKASRINMKFFLILVLFTLLSSCTSQEEQEYRVGREAVAQGRFTSALSSFDHVLKRNTDSRASLAAAREAARVSFFEVRDFQRAIRYYHFLVLYSGDERERVEAQKQIANIYFNNIQNYSQAVIEFSKLLQMPHNDQEATQYKLSIARAQYYLNNFFQAESEVDILLSKKADEDVYFSATMLKGNILVAKKDYIKAAELFKSLMKSFPDKARDENVALVLAVCYEENLDFKGAIAILEEQKKRYQPAEYIELRIKRLKERMKNAPGAKGFRK